jgi:anti-anti-sigma factor
MRIEERKVGTVDVLCPVGPLVDEDSTRFCERLKQRLGSPNIRVVVSLQDVPYMDSTALEGLVDAASEMSDRAAVLKLTNLTPTCREILEITGISDRFRIFSQLEDAVKSFL